MDDLLKTEGASAPNDPSSPTPPQDAPTATETPSGVRCSAWLGVIRLGFHLIASSSVFNRVSSCPLLGGAL